MHFKVPYGVWSLFKVMFSLASRILICSDPLAEILISPKMLGNKIFLWKTTSWNENSTNFLRSYFRFENARWRFWLPKTANTTFPKPSVAMIAPLRIFQAKFRFRKSEALCNRRRTPKAKYPPPIRYPPRKLVVGRLQSTRSRMRTQAMFNIRTEGLERV